MYLFTNNQSEKFGLRPISILRLKEFNYTHFTADFILEHSSGLAGFYTVYCRKLNAAFFKHVRY